MSGPVGDGELICSPWAAIADLPDPKPELPPEEWATLLTIASQILWALTGRQWSGAGCTAVAEYRALPARCGLGLGRLSGWHQDYPLILEQPEPNGMAVLRLPHAEVTAITEVTVNGEPFTDFYRRGAHLIRTDGTSWPGLVLVTYEWGLAPPAAGTFYAARFAVELARALTGDSACRLPRRVTNVVRQQVSMTLLDPSTFLKDGLTGLPDVDQWIVSVNPARRSASGGCWSPDIANAWPV